MKPSNYSKLHDRDERTIAHFEARARYDTIFGGALGLTLAKRAERMGSKNDPLCVVGDVYALSSGRMHKDYGAWECPECGQTHLGQDKAMNCCQSEEYL